MKKIWIVILIIVVIGVIVVFTNDNKGITIDINELSKDIIENIETTEIKYFGLDELPDNLAEEKCTKEQIEMCFQAREDGNWQVQFD